MYLAQRGGGPAGAAGAGICAAGDGDAGAAVVWLVDGIGDGDGNVPALGAPVGADVGATVATEAADAVVWLFDGVGDVAPAAAGAGVTPTAGAEVASGGGADLSTGGGSTPLSGRNPAMVLPSPKTHAIGHTVISPEQEHASGQINRRDVKSPTAQKSIPSNKRTSKLVMKLQPSKPLGCVILGRSSHEPSEKRVRKPPLMIKLT